MRNRSAGSRHACSRWKSSRSNEEPPRLREAWFNLSALPQSNHSAAAPSAPAFWAKTAFGGRKCRTGESWNGEKESYEGDKLGEGKATFRDRKRGLPLDRSATCRAPLSSWPWHFSGPTVSLGHRQRLGFSAARSACNRSAPHGVISAGLCLAAAAAAALSRAAAGCATNPAASPAAARCAGSQR